MEIIDAFRFCTVEKNERALFRENWDLDVCEKDVADKRFYALFNPSVPLMEALAQRNNCHGDTGFFALVDMAQPAILDYANRVGAAGLVLHPYLQNLSGDVLPALGDLLAPYSEAGLPILICTAFGSRKMYRIKPLEVAAGLAERLAGPIVLVHGGGARVLEAMLLADAYPNIYLDTSFSLTYWLGSSVEQDFAFAMRKLGASRWMFGSDAPFWDQKNAIDSHLDFFRRHNFVLEDVAQIMGQTAKELFKDRMKT
jgi:predicted TIM-barrel fold metal-dependent hydrolase